jgi:hypothetical protein
MFAISAFSLHFSALSILFHTAHPPRSRRLSTTSSMRSLQSPTSRVYKRYGFHHTSIADVTPPPLVQPLPYPPAARPFLQTHHVRPLAVRLTVPSLYLPPAAGPSPVPPPLHGRRPRPITIHSYMHTVSSKSRYRITSKAPPSRTMPRCAQRPKLRAITL